MIVDVRTLTLDGFNESIDPPLRLFQTVFFHTPTKVTATAALSTASIGVAPVGTAGAVVWKVGIARPGNGGTDTVDLSQDFLSNGVTFERCVFVTFALSLRRARGVGLYTLHIHG